MPFVKSSSVTVLVLGVLLMCPAPAPAQTDVWPDPIIATDFFQLPLWMAAYQPLETDLVASTQRIEQVVYKDLEFSGLFLVQRKAPTAIGMKESDYSVEVHGKVYREGPDVYFEGWITDVASGDFLGGKKYKLPPKSERRIAHHIADEVVRISTGEIGIATTRIVFTRKRNNQWELVMSDYDGEKPRVLVRQSVPLLNPRWADNNQAVIYTSYRAGKPDLYIRYLKDNKSRTLANYPGSNYASDWSERHRLILAAMSKDGNSEIYLLEKGGAVRKRLTHNRAIDTSPCWSPGGRELVFVSDRSGAPQLYAMEQDGGNVRRLTFTGGYNASPAWSPEGDLIAFVARIGNEFQIVTIKPDGRDGELLTKDARSHEDPRWAPNSRHIVYTERGAGDEVISVIDRVTKGRRILAQGANPDWSSR